MPWERVGHLPTMNARHTALSLAVVLLVAAVAPAAAATAPVGSDAVGDLTVTTAPATTSASAAAKAGTQSDPTNSIVSANDVAVVRLNASGVPAETDDDGTLLGDELAFELQQTQSSVGPNESAKTLDATADTEGVAVNATSDAVYVAVDLTTATFQTDNGTASADAGESFTASATLTDAVTDGENYSRTASFGVVEPMIGFVDEPTEAPAGEVVNYEVITTLAPGTSLTFSMTGEEVAETSTQVTVGEDGRATGQFSFFPFDANEEYQITISSEAAGVNETWTGTTYATGTQTPTPTDTATETSTSAPGFGVVAALLALIGAGAIARRE